MIHTDPFSRRALTALLGAYLATRSRLAPLRTALRGDAGEGVISTAIAVLIVAFIGAAAYVAFEGIFDNATSRTNDVVDTIGG